MRWTGHYLHGIDCVGAAVGEYSAQNGYCVGAEAETAVEKTEDLSSWLIIGALGVGVVALFHWMRD